MTGQRLVIFLSLLSSILLLVVIFYQPETIYKTGGKIPVTYDYSNYERLRKKDLSKDVIHKFNIFEYHSIVRADIDNGVVEYHRIKVKPRYNKDDRVDYYRIIYTFKKEHEK